MLIRRQMECGRARARSSNERSAGRRKDRSAMSYEMARLFAGAALALVLATSAASATETLCHETDQGWRDAFERPCVQRDGRVMPQQNMSVGAVAVRPVPHRRNMGSSANSSFGRFSTGEIGPFTTGEIGPFTTFGNVAPQSTTRLAPHH